MGDGWLDGWLDGGLHGYRGLHAPVDKGGKDVAVGETDKALEEVADFAGIDDFGGPTPRTGEPIGLVFVGLKGDDRVEIGAKARRGEDTPDGHGGPTIVLVSAGDERTVGLDGAMSTCGHVQHSSRIQDHIHVPAGAERRQRCSHPGKGERIKSKREPKRRTLASPCVVPVDLALVQEGPHRSPRRCQRLHPPFQQINNNRLLRRRRIVKHHVLERRGIHRNVLPVGM